MSQSSKRIPYAIADYRQMCEEKGYYVDKTHFIPLLEAAPPYLFFIRAAADRGYRRFSIAYKKT